MQTLMVGIRHSGVRHAVPLLHQHHPAVCRPASYHETAIPGMLYGGMPTHGTMVWHPVVNPLSSLKTERQGRKVRQIPEHRGALHRRPQCRGLDTAVSAAALIPKPECRGLDAIALVPTPRPRHQGLRPLDLAARRRPPDQGQGTLSQR